MTNPTTRVLTVLELLQSHARISGSELARRLAVDVRTVRRYIAALEELGIPVTADQGRYGGYYLVAGFKLPPMMFTNEETLAISLGLLAARNLGLAEADTAIASAEAKLERVMPDKLKRRVRALSEMAVIELPRAQSLGSIEVLADLGAAAREQRRVRISYESSERTITEREFEPYGLVFRRGHWYVGGHCHLRHDLRTFRLDRITELVRLEQRFERPRDFDAVAYLNSSMASIPRANPVVVRLQTTLEEAMTHLNAAVGILVPEGETVLLHTSTDCIEWCARQLCALPVAFSVESPPALRQAVRDHALGIIASAGLSGDQGVN